MIAAQFVHTCDWKYEVSTSAMTSCPAAFARIGSAKYFSIDCGFAMYLGYRIGLMLRGC